MMFAANDFIAQNRPPIAEDMNIRGTGFGWAQLLNGSWLDFYVGLLEIGHGRRIGGVGPSNGSDGSRMIASSVLIVFRPNEFVLMARPCRLNQYNVANYCKKRGRRGQLFSCSQKGRKRTGFLLPFKYLKCFTRPFQAEKVHRITLHAILTRRFGILYKRALGEFAFFFVPSLQRNHPIMNR